MGFSILLRAASSGTTRGVRQTAERPGLKLVDMKVQILHPRLRLLTAKLKHIKPCVAGSSPCPHHLIIKVG